MDDKRNKFRRYIGQVWEALTFYKNLFEENIIILGDFNSNKIWDTETRIANHTDVVEFLSKSDIESIYHKKYNQEQGEETIPTFYLQRNLEKPYHIDYIFLSNQLIDEASQFKIPKAREWIHLSDHKPLFLTTQFPICSCKTNTLVENISTIIKSLEGETRNALHDQLEKIIKQAEKFDQSGNEKLRRKIISFIEELQNINNQIISLKSRVLRSDIP